MKVWDSASASTLSKHEAIALIVELSTQLQQVTAERDELREKLAVLDPKSQGKVISKEEEDRETAKILESVADDENARIALLGEEKMFRRLLSSSDPQIQAAACVALCNLAGDDRTRQGVGAKFAREIVNFANSEDESIAVNGLAAASLCLEDSSLLSPLIDNGILRAFARGVQHMAGGGEGEGVCWALAGIAKIAENEERQGELLTHVTIKQLISLLKSKKEPINAFAMWGISNLAGNEGSKLPLLLGGVLEVVKSSLEGSDLALLEHSSHFLSNLTENAGSSVLAAFAAGGGVEVAVKMTRAKSLDVKTNALNCLAVFAKSKEFHSLLESYNLDPLVLLLFSGEDQLASKAKSILLHSIDFLPFSIASLTLAALQGQNKSQVRDLKKKIGSSTGTEEENAQVRSALCVFLDELEKQEHGIGRTCSRRRGISVVAYADSFHHHEETKDEDEDKSSSKDAAGNTGIAEYVPRRNSIAQFLRDGALQRTKSGGGGVGGGESLATVRE